MMQWFNDIKSRIEECPSYKIYINHTPNQEIYIWPRNSMDPDADFEFQRVFKVDEAEHHVFMDNKCKPTNIIRKTSTVHIEDNVLSIYNDMSENCVKVRVGEVNYHKTMSLLLNNLILTNSSKLEESAKKNNEHLEQKKVADEIAEEYKAAMAVDTQKNIVTATRAMHLLKEKSRRLQFIRDASFTDKKDSREGADKEVVSDSDSDTEESESDDDSESTLVSSQNSSKVTDLSESEDEDSGKITVAEIHVNNAGCSKKLCDENADMSIVDYSTQNLVDDL